MSSTCKLSTPRNWAHINTKVHVAVNDNVLPVKALITSGTVADCSKAIELIENRALKIALDYLENCGDGYRILIMPDHPTPLNIKTHSSEPVPYLIYDSTKNVNGVETFTEATAKSTGNFVEHGPDIMEKLLQKM